MPLQDALVRCCSSPDPRIEAEDNGYVICLNCSEKHDTEEILAAMRLQTESQRKPRGSATDHWHTKDVKKESVTASAQEVNDKEAQPKKVNFDIPNVLPPRDDLSQNERCADMRKFIDYLQGINLENPLTCIMNDDVGPCDYPIARRYQRDHPVKFKDAAEILIREVDLVREKDFIKVVRTYFCGTHDFSLNAGRKAFRIHFLKLWNETSPKLRAEVWDALQKCERNSYPRGPSTPQQERPSLERAVKSVPKEVPRASETMTPSLDPTVEPPTRPWTAQGNLTQDSKVFRSGSDVTPSKTSRALTGSPIAIATESKTDSSDINSRDVPKRSINRNEWKLPDTFRYSQMQPSNQSTTTLGARPFGIFSDHAPSHRPQRGPESSLVDQKMLSHGLPDPFGDKNPASEARPSPLFDKKVTGPSKTPAPTLIKPRTTSVLPTDSQQAPRSIFGSHERSSSPLKVHMGAESSLKEKYPSIQNWPKTFEFKVPEQEPRRTLLSDMEAPFVREAPSWWPKRDDNSYPQLPPTEKDPEGAFLPFKGKSIFDKLGECGRNMNKDLVHTPQNTMITPRLTSPRRTTPDAKLQLPRSEKDPKETSMPIKGKPILDNQDDGDKSAKKDHVHTPQNSIVIPHLTSPPKEPRKTALRSTTPDIEFRLPGAWIDSCETPVTPKSDPTTLPPELSPPSGNLQDVSTQTGVPQIDAHSDQTPIVSSEQSTAQALSPNARNDSKHLDDLSAALEELDIASSLPKPPLFQDDSRSRASSPLPPCGVQSPCDFPLRSATYMARQIRKILKKEITGSIYVLEAPEFFSASFEPSRSKEEIWYKIGIAADVDERIKEISSACGISGLKEVYSTVPNIRYDVLKVIEAICHAQLNNSRRYMDCGRYGLSSKCATKHKEWFAVPKEVAVNTVKMWKAFLDHNPYGHDGVLNERWSSSLKRNYPSLEHDGRVNQDELLHQSLEAWIRRTAEEQE
jgi:hypothetical protein